jgi:DNA-binding transcriptional ArsR family regulator/protein-L-isoaspartate O-methyltransferase
MNLADVSHLFRTLADPTRVRLLSLLEQDELTVAELAQITQLAQPRVSTHLASLKKADLVIDRRAGSSSFYRLNDANADLNWRTVWNVLLKSTDDALLDADSERLPAVLAARAGGASWADQVAGDMERHYSPGRTWESFFRTVVKLLDLGAVLDIASGDGVLGQILAPVARSVTCVDVSERVVSAARSRLKSFANVRVERGDMHALDYPEAHFDQVFLMNALTYSTRPDKALREVSRVLKPGGGVLLSTLKRHAYAVQVADYGHHNSGFDISELEDLSRAAGLKIRHVEIIAKEKRAPHFEVIALSAHKPKKAQP